MISIRLFFKIAAVFLLFILLGSIGSAYFFFETRTGSSLLFKGIHTYFKTQNIDLTLEGLEGDFPKNFSINIIELKDTSSQKPILQGEHLHLSWDWTSLFRGKVILKNLSLKKLSFFSIQDTKSTPKSPHQMLQESIQDIQSLFALPYFVKISQLNLEEGFFTLENGTHIDFNLSGFADFNTQEKRLSLKVNGISLPWQSSLEIEGSKEMPLKAYFLFEDKQGIFFEKYGSFKCSIDLESLPNNDIIGNALIQMPSLGEGTLKWKGNFSKDLVFPFEGQIHPSPALLEQEPYLSDISFQGNFLSRDTFIKLQEMVITASYGSMHIPNLNIIPFSEQDITTHLYIEKLPIQIPINLQKFLPVEYIDGSLSFTIPKENQDISFNADLKSGEAISLLCIGSLSTLENRLSFNSFTFKTLEAILDGKGNIRFTPEETYLSLPLTFSLSLQEMSSLNTQGSPLSGILHLEGPISHLTFQSEIQLPFIEYEGDSFSDLTLMFTGTKTNTFLQLTPTLKGTWRDASFIAESICQWEEGKGLSIDSFSFNHPISHAQGKFILSEPLPSSGYFTFNGQAFPFLKDVLFSDIKGNISWDSKGIKGSILGNHGKIFDASLVSLKVTGEAQNWQGKDLSITLEMASLKIGEIVFPTFTLFGKGDLDVKSPFLKGSLLLSNPVHENIKLLYSYSKNFEKSTLSLTAFKGKLGKTDISLPKDLLITYTPSFIKIPKTELLINKKAVSFSFAKEESTLKGALHFSTLAFKDLQGLISAFQFPLILKNGELLLSGSTQNPQIVYKVELEPAPSSEGWGPAIPSFSGHIQGIGKNHLLEGALSLQTSNNLEYTKGTWKIPFGNEETTHQIAITFEGKGSLETIAPFIAQQGDVLKGQYQANFNVKGSLQKPLIKGNLSVEKGLFQSFKFGTLFQDITLQIIANNTALTLTQGAAHDAKGGTISLSGDYAWGGERSTLLAQLSNFQIVALDMVNAQATGNLTLQKESIDLPILKGSIQLEPLAVHIPKKLPPHIYTFDVKRIGKSEITSKKIEKEDKLLLKGISEEIQEKMKIRPLPPYTEEESVVLSNTTMPAFPLNIQVNLPDKFTVEGYGLSSSWNGQVQVGGTLQDPNLSGTIHIQKGSFTFLGKTFSLQKGYLLFTGQSTLDPDVDIVAQITTAGITANVLIAGKLSTPQFTLTSNPLLPSNEIVSRILFGKDMGSLSPLQSLQIVSALSELTGTASPTSFVDQIRDSLGLGGLSFTGSDGSGGGLSLGKYLSDDVFVNVEQGLEEGSTKASVEVKVLPDVTLQSDVGADSSAGVGVNWRYEY